MQLRAGHVFVSSRKEMREEDTDWWQIRYTYEELRGRFIIETFSLCFSNWTISLLIKRYAALNNEWGMVETNS